MVEIPGGGPIVFVGDHHQLAACAHAHFASLVASGGLKQVISDGVSCRAPRAVLQACRLRLRVLRTSTPPLRTVEPPFACGGYQSTPHVSVYSARRRRRYAQSNRHSSVEVISRRTSSQSSTDAVYSARLRVLRTSTPPLRTVEPPFVCGGYQSSDVKSVINGRRVLRTSPCTPHVDAAVTHSRTAIRLWRLSVVGRQVSRQRTPCTPHVSVYSARRRRRYAQSNRHSSVEVISRRTSSQRTPCTPHVSVYSARRRRRYAQPNRHSPVEVISRRT
jgi:hypothetical protein